MRMGTRKVPGTNFTRPNDPSEQDSPAPGQYGAIKLFSGSASGDLANEIAEYIGVALSPCDIIRFSNENIFIQLKNSARGQDVYLIQTMTSPVSDNIMELLIMLDALKRDSAGRITAVVPYLAYGRSDKKDQPRAASARALTDYQLIRLAAAELTEIVNEDPGIALQMIRSLVRRV